MNSWDTIPNQKYKGTSQNAILNLSDPNFMGQTAKDNLWKHNQPLSGRSSIDNQHASSQGLTCENLRAKISYFLHINEIYKLQISHNLLNFGSGSIENIITQQP